MKLQDINTKIIEIAIKYGYKINSVTFFASFHGSSQEKGIQYSCTIFTGKIRIESGFHNGYDAMLDAIEKNTIHHQLIYSKESQITEI